MHVVLGDGEMPVQELTAHLQDLWDKDNAADQDFWFLVQAKAEPTVTDEALMAWLNSNNIYYQTIGDGSDVSDIYANSQEKYSVKRLAEKIVNLMKTTPVEGEDAQMLALFVSPDPDADEDRWVNDVVQQVCDAGFKVFALNDGMVEIDMESQAEASGPEEEEETVAEPEEAPAPAKKTAASKRAAAPVEAEEATPVLTREDLEGRPPSEIKEIALKAGITLPPRTRMPTYIDAILKAQDEVLGGVADEIEVTPEDVTEAVTTSIGSSMTGSITITSGQMESPSMLIVVFNGTVVSRSITPEQALELIRQ